MDIGKILYFLLQGFFLGYGPCLLTCAPIILPYAGTKRTWQEGFCAALSFSLSRLAVYTVLGGISGYFGAYMLNIYYASNVHHYTQLIVSAVLILIGVFVLMGRDTSMKFCRAGEGNMVVLGILVALSPCLPLIGILLEIALLSRDLISGFVLSFAFGIGTVISPLLLLGALVPALGGRLDQKMFKVFRYICAVMIILVGLYSLFFKGAGYVF